MCKLKLKVLKFKLSLLTYVEWIVQLKQLSSGSATAGKVRVANVNAAGYGGSHFHAGVEANAGRRAAGPYMYDYVIHVARSRVANYELPLSSNLLWRESGSARLEFSWLSIVDFETQIFLLVSCLL